MLENNAGLLERDFATNKPFYDKFEIKSATKLDEPDVQICYCLKAAINTRFLRKMIEGTLDEELGNTVGTFPLTPTTACLFPILYRLCLAPVFALRLTFISLTAFNNSWP